MVVVVGGPTEAVVEKAPPKVAASGAPRASAGPMATRSQAAIGAAALADDSKGRKGCLRPSCQSIILHAGSNELAPRRTQTLWQLISQSLQDNESPAAVLSCLL